MNKYIFFGLGFVAGLLVCVLGFFILRLSADTAGPIFIPQQGSFAEKPSVEIDDGIATIRWSTTANLPRNEVVYQFGNYQSKSRVHTDLVTRSQKNEQTGLFVHNAQITTRELKEGAAFLQQGTYYYQVQSSDLNTGERNISEVLSFTIN